MSEKTLKFGDVINKKEFYASKQVIALNFVNPDKIVISEKFRHSDNGIKYFIGYLDDDIIRPLCVILPQMSAYIKYFDDGEKNMSFKIEDEYVFLKYNEIWNKIRKTLSIEFHSQPIYDEKYIKSKVKAFSKVINTVFSNNEISKERNHYICTAAINIHSVLKINKKTILTFIWNNVNTR